MANYSEKQLDIFKRLGNQLELTRTVLETHPLVSGKLNILQTVLQNFKMQTLWSSAGQTARLLMTFQMALIGQEVGQSEAGVVGPTWQTLQKAVYGLMKATMSLTEKRQADLLLTFNEIVSLGGVYIATQMLGKWDKIFYQGDKPAAKKAGHLLRELGLTFLIQSKVIEVIYREVSEGLGLSEKSRKLIVDVGVFFILMLLLMVDAEDSPSSEELFEAFIPMMRKAVEGVEQAAQMAQDQGMMNEETGMVVLSQIQLMKSALASGEPAVVREAMEGSFQGFDLSYGEMKKDLTRVIKFCTQLHESLNNVFYQSKQSVTSMTQAA